MRYTQEQLALLRERWRRPLVGTGEPIEGASTLGELLALRMSGIRELLGAPPLLDPSHLAEVRKTARQRWNQIGQPVLSRLMEELKAYGLEELFPIETPRYQIRDTCDLRGAALKEALFTGAFLENVHLEGADVSGAGFRFARCFETHFEDAECARADFGGAECHFSTFAGAGCEHIVLDHADCTMVCFDRAILREGTFTGTICFAASFGGAFLARAELSGIKINHLTRFGIPGEIDIARRSKPASREDDDWYIVDLFPAWLQAAQVCAQIRFLLKDHGFFLEADEYQYLEMVCQRHTLHYNSLRRFFEWVFKDLMFGYGLKWRRPLFTVLSVILLWGAGFAVHFRVSAAHGLLTSIGHGLYYSVIAFTTLGFGNTPDLEGPWAKTLLCSEALIGTVLMPLFLLAYARKILQD